MSELQTIHESFRKNYTIDIERKETGDSVLFIGTCFHMHIGDFYYDAIIKSIRWVAESRWTAKHLKIRFEDGNSIDLFPRGEGESE